ncbi:MAG: hypothetical protein FJ096_13860 [Deltaproteobacteria bacterium]|nr:hypothetical protein [Deltaproteobacteria bacterium]
MSESNPFQFKRKDVVDEPGIVGATWWNVALEHASTRETRRSVLKWLAITGGVVAATGGLIALASSDPQDEGEKKLQPALEMQRDYGWRFGATDETLVLGELDLMPVSAGATEALKTLFAPKNPKLAPYALRTLLESPSATPRKQLAEPEEPSFVPLVDSLRQPLTPTASPFTTSARRYVAGLANPVAAGQGAASVPPGNDAATPGGAVREALIVDLPSSAAIEFAAGASSVFEPVLLFDNWPHPRGVVPSHRALVAMLSLAEGFKLDRDRRPDDAPPMFLLGIERLATYTEGAEQFDNRYVAKLPDAASLKALGITRVTYVTHGRETPIETEDLHDDFVAYAAAGLELRSVLTSALDPSASAIPFKPTPRPTMHGQGRTREASFGTVPVLVAVGTGVVLGSMLRRSGSRYRATSSWGGG